MSRVVVVGAGTSAGQLAIALRAKGFDGEITLIGDEDHAPYNRPPLSKGWLTYGEDEPVPALPLRPDAFWREQDVRIVLGTRVTSIDRAAHRVHAAGGSSWEYDHLVLATGARNRTLPGLSDTLGLRGIADANAVRERLVAGSTLAVVGGGFIGLELAAAARHRGVEVTVVEAQERLMSRALAPETALHLHREHERHGVRIILGRTVRGRDEAGITLDDGSRVDAETVVVGVGVVPNAELAIEAGLEVGDGIVVDEHLTTTDASISAIGDCARHHCVISGADVRLESVQNATDQAAHVATRLVGGGTPYEAVPWFWTKQYDLRVQIAGVAQDADRSVVVGDPDEGAFSTLRFAGDRLVGVDSVSRAADHLAARKLLAAHGAGLTPESATAPNFTLKSYLTTIVV